MVGKRKHGESYTSRRSQIVGSTDVKNLRNARDTQFDRAQLSLSGIRKDATPEKDTLYEKMVSKMSFPATKEDGKIDENDTFKFDPPPFVINVNGKTTYEKVKAEVSHVPSAIKRLKQILRSKGPNKISSSPQAISHDPEIYTDTESRPRPTNPESENDSKIDHESESNDVLPITSEYLPEDSGSGTRDDEMTDEEDLDHGSGQNTLHTESQRWLVESRKNKNGIYNYQYEPPPKISRVNGHTVYQRIEAKVTHKKPHGDKHKVTEHIIYEQAQNDSEMQKPESETEAKTDDTKPRKSKSHQRHSKPKQVGDNNQEYSGDDEEYKISHEDYEDDYDEDEDLEGEEDSSGILDAAIDVSTEEESDQVETTNPKTQRVSHKKNTMPLPTSESLQIEEENTGEQQVDDVSETEPVASAPTLFEETDDESDVLGSRDNDLPDEDVEADFDNLDDDLGREEDSSGILDAAMVVDSGEGSDQVETTTPITITKTKHVLHKKKTTPLPSSESPQIDKENTDEQQVDDVRETEPESSTPTLLEETDDESDVLGSKEQKYLENAEETQFDRYHLMLSEVRKDAGENNALYENTVIRAFPSQKGSPQIERENTDKQQVDDVRKSKPVTSAPTHLEEPDDESDVLGSRDYDLPDEDVEADFDNLDDDIGREEDSSRRLDATMDVDREEVSDQVETTTPSPITITKSKYVSHKKNTTPLPTSESLDIGQVTTDGQEVIITDHVTSVPPPLEKTEEDLNLQEMDEVTEDTMKNIQTTTHSYVTDTQTHFDVTDQYNDVGTSRAMKNLASGSVISVGELRDADEIKQNMLYNQELESIKPGILDRVDETKEGVGNVDIVPFNPEPETFENIEYNQDGVDHFGKGFDDHDIDYVVEPTLEASTLPPEQPEDNSGNIPLDRLLPAVEKVLKPAYGDTTFGAWGAWSACNATCQEEGERIRNRECLKQNDVCSGIVAQKTTCRSNNCTEGIISCFSKPCLFGGVCHHAEPTKTNPYVKFSCECPAGVTGKLCEYDYRLPLIACVSLASTFLILVLIITICICCRRRSRRNKVGPFEGGHKGSGDDKVKSKPHFDLQFPSLLSDSSDSGDETIFQIPYKSDDMDNGYLYPSKTTASEKSSYGGSGGLKSQVSSYTSKANLDLNKSNELFSTTRLSAVEVSDTGPKTPKLMFDPEDEHENYVRHYLGRDIDYVPGRGEADGAPAVPNDSTSSKSWTSDVVQEDPPKNKKSNLTDDVNSWSSKNSLISVVGAENLNTGPELVKASDRDFGHTDGYIPAKQKSELSENVLLGKSSSHLQKTSSHPGIGPLQSMESQLVAMEIDHDSSDNIMGDDRSSLLLPTTSCQTGIRPPHSMESQQVAMEIDNESSDGVQFGARSSSPPVVRRLSSSYMTGRSTSIPPFQSTPKKGSSCSEITMNESKTRLARRLSLDAVSTSWSDTTKLRATASQGTINFVDPSDVYSQRPQSSLARQRWSSNLQSVISGDDSIIEIDEDDLSDLCTSWAEEEKGGLEDVARQFQYGIFHGGSHQKSTSDIGQMETKLNIGSDHDLGTRTEELSPLKKDRVQQNDVFEPMSPIFSTREGHEGEVGAFKLQPCDTRNPSRERRYLESSINPEDVFPSGAPIPGLHSSGSQGLFRKGKLPPDFQKQRLRQLHSGLNDSTLNRPSISDYIEYSSNIPPFPPGHLNDQSIIAGVQYPEGNEFKSLSLERKGDPDEASSIDSDWKSDKSDTEVHVPGQGCVRADHMPPHSMQSDPYFVHHDHTCGEQGMYQKSDVAPRTRITPSREELCQSEYHDFFSEAMISAKGSRSSISVRKCRTPDSEHLVCLARAPSTVPMTKSVRSKIKFFENLPFQQSQIKCALCKNRHNASKDIHGNNHQYLYPDDFENVDGRERTRSRVYGSGMRQRGSHSLNDQRQVEVIREHEVVDSDRQISEGSTDSDSFESDMSSQSADSQPESVASKANVLTILKSTLGMRGKSQKVESHKHGSGVSDKPAWSFNRFSPRKIPNIARRDSRRGSQFQGSDKLLKESPIFRRQRALLYDEEEDKPREKTSPVQRIAGSIKDHLSSLMSSMFSKGTPESENKREKGTNSQRQAIPSKMKVSKERHDITDKVIERSRRASHETKASKQIYSHHHHRKDNSSDKIVGQVKDKPRRESVLKRRYQREQMETVRPDTETTVLDDSRSSRKIREASEECFYQSNERDILEFWRSPPKLDSVGPSEPEMIQHSLNRTTDSRFVDPCNSSEDTNDACFNGQASDSGCSKAETNSYAHDRCRRRNDRAHQRESWNRMSATNNSQSSKGIVIQKMKHVPRSSLMKNRASHSERLSHLHSSMNEAGQSSGQSSRQQLKADNELLKNSPHQQTNMSYDQNITSHTDEPASPHGPGESLKATFNDIDAKSWNSGSEDDVTTSKSRQQDIVLDASVSNKEGLKISPVAAPYFLRHRKQRSLDDFSPIEHVTAESKSTSDTDETVSLRGSGESLKATFTDIDALVDVRDKSWHSDDDVSTSNSRQPDIVLEDSASNEEGPKISPVAAPYFLRHRKQRSLDDLGHIELLNTESQSTEEGIDQNENRLGDWLQSLQYDSPVINHQPHSFNLPSSGMLGTGLPSWSHRVTDDGILISKVKKEFMQEERSPSTSADPSLELKAQGKLTSRLSSPPLPQITDKEIVISKVKKELMHGKRSPSTSADPSLELDAQGTNDDRKQTSRLSSPPLPQITDKKIVISKVKKELMHAKRSPSTSADPSLELEAQYTNDDSTVTNSPKSPPLYHETNEGIVISKVKKEFMHQKRSSNSLAGIPFEFDQRCTNEQRTRTSTPSSPPTPKVTDEGIVISKVNKEFMYDPSPSSNVGPSLTLDAVCTKHASTSSPTSLPRVTDDGVVISKVKKGFMHEMSPSSHEEPSFRQDASSSNNDRPLTSKSTSPPSPRVTDKGILISKVRKEFMHEERSPSTSADPSLELKAQGKLTRRLSSPPIPQTTDETIVISKLKKELMHEKRSPSTSADPSFELDAQGTNDDRKQTSRLSSPPLPQITDKKIVISKVKKELMHAKRCPSTSADPSLELEAQYTNDDGTLTNSPKSPPLYRETNEGIVISKVKKEFMHQKRSSNSLAGIPFEFDQRCTNEQRTRTSTPSSPPTPKVTDEGIVISKVNKEFMYDPSPSSNVGPSLTLDAVCTKHASTSSPTSLPRVTDDGVVISKVKKGFMHEMSPSSHEEPSFRQDASCSNDGRPLTSKSTSPPSPRVTDKGILISKVRRGFMTEVSTHNNEEPSVHDHDEDDDDCKLTSATTSLPGNRFSVEGIVISKVRKEFMHVAPKAEKGNADGVDGALTQGYKPMHGVQTPRLQARSGQDIHSFNLPPSGMMGTGISPRGNRVTNGGIIISKVQKERICKEDIDSHKETTNLPQSVRRQPIKEQAKKELLEVKFMTMVNLQNSARRRHDNTNDFGRRVHLMIRQNKEHCLTSNSLVAGQTGKEVGRYSQDVAVSMMGARLDPRHEPTNECLTVQYKETSYGGKGGPPMRDYDDSEWGNTKRGTHRLESTHTAESSLGERAPEPQRDVIHLQRQDTCGATGEQDSKDNNSGENKRIGKGGATRIKGTLRHTIKKVSFTVTTPGVTNSSAQTPSRRRYKMKTFIKRWKNYLTHI